MSTTLLPLTMIVAIADDGTIGDKGGLPWPRIDADMKRFREHTMGHAVLMGNATWKSLPTAGLPGRRCIIVSKTQRFPDLAEDEPWPAAVWGSLEAALFAARATDAAPVIIGGAQLYRAAMPLVTRILLTEVHCSPGGDTKFELDRTGFTEVSREMIRGNVHPITFDFVELVRTEGLVFS